MGRLRSDVGAVVAIVVGVAAGAAGTVGALKATEGAPEPGVACVEVGAPRVVFAVPDGSASIAVEAPAPGGSRSACAEVHRTRSVTVVRSDPGRRARILVRADEIRRRSEAVRKEAERLRLRADPDRSRPARVSR